MTFTPLLLSRKRRKRKRSWTQQHIMRLRTDVSYIEDKLLNSDRVSMHAPSRLWGSCVFICMQVSVCMFYIFMEKYLVFWFCCCFIFLFFITGLCDEKEFYAFSILLNVFLKIKSWEPWKKKNMNHAVLLSFLGHVTSLFFFKGTFKK